MSESAEKLLERAVERYMLSARGHDRVSRLARTIADLADSDTIDQQHIAEAIQLRSMDKRQSTRELGKLQP